MDDYDFEKDYQDPIDVRRFCNGLRDAWLLTPESSFAEILETIFNGYDLGELTSVELETMLNDYILQNQ